ncbi:hypothetical protein PFNF135_04236 [Plasmodium falciparum NF135/5.C10]|uniref:Erythrocyte membrane protein 1 n=1 Tax=Plasmodium falciparum NF135/5.C10 TaxID=1036726 RepID=W4IC45_PLAFA|nr:hypothetical protein PFNF135_04236 [Plasmodium falciparum NF135/5.C10]
MAPPSAVTDYSKATDAKDFLDIIGKDVYETVKKEAETYKGELEGKLSQVSVKSETASTDKPCTFDYDEHTTSANGNTKPCGKDGNDVKRFSKERVDEYDNKKMKCSNGGACAPLRRLSLCNKNMENMDTNNNDGKAKHDLLAEVCYAAKFEGQSIKTHYKRYDAEYPSDSSHTTCTALARSFADIGDIVRGKDLYLGNKKKNQTERDKLEQKLKDIFKQIHEGLTNGELKTRYRGDPDFLKLREDWWTANRETVWKAITCGTHDGDTYFHATCSDSHRKESCSQANHYCRCGDDKPGEDKPNIDPPTYFDYVPQYLRWFEEWAEDFCRKKKKYVNIVKTYCRGKDKDGKERYCSRNGYDCEKTISRIGKVRMGKGCTDCFFACYPYEKWIEKQKEQFDKQKERYDKEIKKYESGASGSGNGRAKRSVSTKVYDGYEKKFYLKLQSNGYGDVNDFLGLLSKEKACTAITDGGIINFKNVDRGKHSSGGTSDTSGTNDKEKGTFYRSEYCQPCPDCGVERDGNEWKEKDKSKEKCAGQILYKPKCDDVGTTINFLYSGDETNDIAKRLKEFCETQNGSVAGGSGTSGSNELYQKWKCYEIDELTKYGQDGVEDEDDVPSGGGLCILKKEKKGVEETNPQKEPDEIQKTFHNFFYYWVAHMLKDSIYWETQKLKSCISNGAKIRCRNNEKCKTDCGCFEKWVKQKETEWNPIKQQFRKQEGLDSEGGNSSHPSLNLHMTPDVVLEWILELEFSKENSTEDAENNVSAKEIDLINEMLEKEKSQVVGADSKKKNTIDLLIQHEEDDAKECKQKQDECNRQQENTGGAARSGPLTPGGPQSPGPEEPEEDDEDDDDDDDEEKAEESKAESKEETDVVEDQGEETAKEEEGTTQVNVCSIVEQALKLDNLTDACNLKYVKGKNYGWRCVPSGSTPESGGDKDGAICVPPRRRRLYVTPLTKWANNSGSNTAVGGKAPPASPPATASTSPQVALLRDAQVELRDAFIQSAAIETFFLWDRYKKIKEKEEAETDLVVRKTSNDPEQKQLEGGEIPNDFLRQMFYTLGDYRDILFGNNIGRFKDMKEVEKKIKSVFPNTQKTTGANTARELTREQWWNDYGEDIWKGMLCGLSYASKNKETVREKLTTEHQNSYNTVTINGGPSSGTSLSEFASRPTFFRWLEEWGEEFCRKKKIKIDKIINECRSHRGGHQYCSGDGYDCEDDRRRYNDMFAHLDCRDCERECRNYNKWIRNKKNEFDNQNNKYVNEIEKLISSLKNESDREFYNNLNEKGYTSINSFLESLNQGKVSQYNKDKNYKIDFKNPENTFNPSTYCKVCPFYGVTRARNGEYKPINSKLENTEEGEPTVFDILLDNGATDVTDKKLQEKCTEYGLYKDLRKQQWECQKQKDEIYQCNIINTVDHEHYDDKIPFNILFHRWINDFMQYYNKSKERITRCTKKSENKCECVKEWLEIKKQEWEKIKNYYNENLKTNNELIPSRVKSFFEQEPFHSLAEEAKKVVKCKGEQDKLWGCTGDNLDGNEKNCKDDFITNLIKKLTEKIGQCQSKHNGTDCSDTPQPQTLEDETLDDDIETEEVKAPNICPQQETAAQPEPEVEDDCKPAATPSDETPVLKPEEEAPAQQPPAQPLPQPKTPQREFTPSDWWKVMSASAFPWTVGVAFVALMVLEPSKRDTQNDIHNDIPSDIPNSDTPPPITDDEWNKLKKDFISNMLQNTQNTEPNILRDNVDNNTHPTTSHHNVEEKPFIMSIHDRNLFSGEEYNYDMFNSGNNPINISDSTNSMDSLTSNNHSPYNDKNDLYSGIDLINDALSGNHIDIYDEMLKRKENELFGTKHHTKHTNTYNVAKPARDDPITNQLELFHKWLDRHRDMCEKWKNNHERLPKLKELWENETHSGDINSGIPSGNHVLNTDVSIQIDMDNPKPKNEFTNMDTNPDKSTMDTILDDLEKYNEPYYYDFYKDDMIYYDVHDDEPSIDDIKMEVPNKVQIEMNVVNNKKDLLEEEYLISDIWNI